MNFHDICLYESYLSISIYLFRSQSQHCSQLFQFVVQGSKEQGERGERPPQGKNLVPLKALSDVFVTKHLETERQRFVGT